MDGFQGEEATTDNDNSFDRSSRKVCGSFMHGNSIRGGAHAVSSLAARVPATHAGNTSVIFPYSGEFRGTAYNTQSLYAYEIADTINAVARIAQPADFTIVSETRETAERKASLDHRLLSDHTYFSSYLDAHKGGVGILIKKAFLDKFPFTDLDNCWKVLVRGRIGRLCLAGPKGWFHIYAVYFDPSDKRSQKQGVAALSEHWDSRVHSLVAGDFNFVECEQDRYIKSSGAWSIGEDKAVAKDWHQFCTKTGIKEWEQPHFTCETGIVLSRIDRIYSNLHVINAVVANTFASVLERDSVISAHRPLIFGLRAGGRGRANLFPDWVTDHADFVLEVNAEYEHFLAQQTRGVSGFQRLDGLRGAMRKGAKYVKYKSKKTKPQTTDHKISATVAFLRAAALGDLQTARKMQGVYDMLKQVDLTGQYLASPEYKTVQDHAVELVQTSTQERINELRNIRSMLPDHIYRQRKENILNTLKGLIPGSPNKIESIREEATAEVVSDPTRIGKVLTEYWQRVFDDKPTNASLRREWLDRFRKRLKRTFSVGELRPTMEDVISVLSSLPTSAPGPDGVPFSAFKGMKTLLAPILFDVIQEMIEGTHGPDELFNRAYLICLPKTDAEVHEPGGTRPLSIVDAINRIIASVFRIALERAVGKYISEPQRGFIQGRHMLRNILEIDYQAQRISIKSNKGAIILLDFKAAFPSINHTFMWEALAAWGLPTNYIAALKMFYTHNKHTMRMGGAEMQSIEVHSGVRQGCPLSPIIFALCADVLLTELMLVLGEDEVVRAFADDTGVVVRDYEVSLPTLQKLFSEFAAISGMALNIKKTVLIPLWPITSLDNVRRLVREICPPWKDVVIDTCAKYLGFYIGPGAVDKSWGKPLQKYNQRVALWSSQHLGLCLNIVAYRTFIASVLTFVMQLEPLPTTMLDVFDAALRKLAPGPGMWATRADLCNLEAAYEFAGEFPDPRWTALASKLRVVYTMARDCSRFRHELLQCQMECGRRPFPAWHDRCYFCVLAKAEAELSSKGVDWRVVSSRLKAEGGRRRLSFQRCAEQLIRKTLAAPYFQDARLRAKCVHWKFRILDGHLEQRVMARMRLLHQRCPPRIQAVYFRTLWNGWVCYDRMKRLLKQRGCLLGCGWDDDSLFHYGCCGRYWEFIHAPCPRGLGVSTVKRSRDAAFLIASELDDSEVIRLAIGLYALYRTVNTVRFASDGQTFDTSVLLRLHAKSVGGCRRIFESKYGPLDC